MTQLRILELAQATTYRNLSELENRQDNFIELYRCKNPELKIRIDQLWTEYFELERMVEKLKMVDEDAECRAQAR